MCPRSCEAEHAIGAHRASSAARNRSRRCGLALFAALTVRACALAASAGIAALGSARAQDAGAPSPAEEGDLRNQTFVPTLDFEREQALDALRRALARGALREALEAASQLALGDASELVKLDERLCASPREAVLHLFAGADPALREALARRHAVPPSAPDARPLSDEALLELERRAPLGELACATLERAGDERFAAGDPLAAAALYRRARRHAEGLPALEARRRACALRAAACAAILESPSARAEVAALHGVEDASDGPEGVAFRTWLDRARPALGADGAPPSAAGTTAPPQFELAWCEPLDADGERRRLSADRGIRGRGPRALETDLRPAFAAGQVLVQDRRYLYRFDAQGGRRLERVELDAACRALGIADDESERGPALGTLRRAPAASEHDAILVHDEARGILLALRIGSEPLEPARATWAISGGVLYRDGLAASAVGEPAEAPPVFQPAPLLLDARVYALARRTSAGKERLELWCCDRESGEPHWTRTLCEGTPVRSQTSRSLRPSGGTLPTSAPVYSDGLIFVATSLGVLAACDALDGSVAWLLKTARSAEAGPRWSTADPIATRQGVFCGPQDADFFYALRRELPLGASRASALFLLPPIARGALEAHLVADGPRHYFYVRTPYWREVAELALEPVPEGNQEGGLGVFLPRWRTSGDTGSQEEDLLYLPAFSSGELVLCTDRYLYSFDCARGFLATFRSRAPLSPATAAPLPTRQVFGNVAAYRTGIVVVGSEGVSFWNRRS